MDTQDDNSKGRKTFTEEIEIAGDKLIERIKEIVEEGNVRSLRLKASDGDIVLETPLTIGVLAGRAVALAAPWLAILGVLAISGLMLLRAMRVIEPRIIPAAQVAEADSRFRHLVASLPAATRADEETQRNRGVPDISEFAG